MIDLFSHWNSGHKVWCRRKDVSDAPSSNAWTTQRLIDDLTSWAGSVDYTVRDVHEIGTDRGHYLLFAGHVHEAQKHPDLVDLMPEIRELVIQGQINLLFFYGCFKPFFWLSAKGPPSAWPAGPNGYRPGEAASSPGPQQQV